MFFLPIFAYAEIHYRFKYFLSFIKRNEPEIIADAPHRINPNAKLPILILIKDADKYSITILRIIIEIRQNENIIFSQVYSKIQKIKVFGHWWWNIIEIPFLNELQNVWGFLDVNVDVEFERNGNIYSIRNNNLPTSSKKSLKIFRSKTVLPALRGWIHGDTHTHSNYTEDQVEFGAPIQASLILSQAIGLSFFCVCDHSYDLDDRLDTYLINDPSLPKWNMLQKEIDEINSEQKECVVIRGEEVTARNANGRNVHFLLWGTRKFFAGSGDSAEKWFRLRSEHSIQEILENTTSSTVAFASHPTEKVPSLHRFFFGRDVWSLNDMRNTGLHGLQILNGEYSSAFFKGLSDWKKLLLEGKKLFVAAGNDAHGNFNRYVQLQIPFLKIAEKETQIFGKLRSTVYCNALNETNILGALKVGKCVINNGPLVICEVENEFHQSAKIGGQIQAKSVAVKVQGISTEEFGEFASVKIYFGVIGKSEIILTEQNFENGKYEIHFITEWQQILSFSYIRVEAFTKNGIGYDKNGFCYTNPIWMLPE